jgi:putative NADPH-quinone reductase/cold shock CspA family protein
LTLARHVVDILTHQGQEVVLENLYADHFDPVLSPQERAQYYAAVYDTSAVKEEVSRLINADVLVLIFPTWWFGFPAILKGWFDRVWAPTIAYDHATDFGPIKPKLNRLKRTFIITTLGAPWWVDYFILWRPVKRVIRFALLGACAQGSKLTYLSFYKCENLKKEKIKAEDIEIGIPKKEVVNDDSGDRTGIVNFFDESKGFGFINDSGSGERIFFHVSGLVDEIRENDKVSFQTVKGQKGLNAIEVKLIK